MKAYNSDRNFGTAQRRAWWALLLGAILFAVGLYGTRAFTPRPDQISGNGIFPPVLVTWLVALMGFALCLGAAASAWPGAGRRRAASTVVAVASILAATVTSTMALLSYSDWANAYDLGSRATWPQYLLHHLPVNVWVWLTAALVVVAVLAARSVLAGD